MTVERLGQPECSMMQSHSHPRITSKVRVHDPSGLAAV